MPKKRRPTQIDERVLKAIIDHVDSLPYQPSERDLGSSTGLANGSVGTALKRLQRFGYVDRVSGISRSIRPTDAGRRHLVESGVED